MSRRSLIWGLAGDVSNAPDEGQEKLAVTLAVTKTAQNEELASQNGQVALPLQEAPESVTLNSKECDANLKKLISEFRAACANFNTAAEKETELAARIKNGEQYCTANPADKGAAKLLIELRLQRVKIGHRLEWEALQQHDIEKSILQEAGLPRGYVCGVCVSVVALGTCECWKGALNA